MRVAMPQADGENKPRPAVLIKCFPPDQDWLMLGISGSLGRAVPGFDVVIDHAHPSFATARLSYPGVIRLAHAHILSEEEVEGIMGKVDAATLALLKKRFADHILTVG